MNLPHDRYVIQPNGCWQWRGTMNNLGYGRIQVDGSWRQAHRIFYETLVGPIPDGLEIDHLCRNRACVNPAHLEPVTPAENTRRGLVAKLTHQQVAFIRASSASSIELAARFGVTKETIYRARRGLSWNYDGAPPLPPKLKADATHCIHGHEYTPENTRRTVNGHRKCRTCDRAAEARRPFRPKKRRATVGADLSSERGEE